MKLLAEQLASKNKLSAYKVGALFMEPGTGKTRSAIELIETTDADCVVWFTPFQTKENLRLELELWTKRKVHIVGVESIQNSDRLYLRIVDLIQKAQKVFLVMDESLKIKNSDAKRTKRMLYLSKLSEYRLILNGTPLSKNLLDLWSQMEFLSPTILGMSETQFKNTFCEYKEITVRKPGTYRSRSKSWIVRYHNLDYLYALIEPYVYECDLRLDIGKQYIDVSFELEEEEKEKHQEIIDRILSDDWLMAKPNFFLELTQKLQNNYSRSPMKFEVVKNLLQNNKAEHLLIFAKYIETQEKLKKAFPDVRVLSYQKHSFGLNLQQYNRIIFFDKIWDYALREQAERRIYRAGQQEDCIFYDLTGNVGLEQMIDTNIARKSDLLKEFKKLSLEEFKKLAA